MNISSASGCAFYSSTSDACQRFVQVKIVIIDSITFHFRQDFDMALRTRLLSGMALKLMKLAKKFCLAVRHTYYLYKL